MAKLKLPFELEKPSPNEFVTQASEIGYGGISVACGIIYDISVAKSVNNVPTRYESLSAALGTNGANIPQDIRRGGMSIKFMQSSDNKYIQARCMDQNFTTDVTKWQVVSDHPAVGSKDLVESAGIEWSDDYTRLFVNGESIIPINDGQIANNNTFVLGNGSHKAIPVNGGDSITIVKNGNYNAQIFWLKSYIIPTSGNITPDFCSGHTSRETLDSGTYTVPSDCKYLVIGYLTSTTNIYPSDIKINGYSIFNSVTKIQQDINTNKTNISENATSIEKLNPSIGSLKSRLYGIDVFQISAVINRNNKYNAASDMASAVIFAKGGDVIFVENTNNQSNISFCTSLNSVKNGASPEFCSGESGRRMIQGEATLSAPSDCKYIILQTKYSGVNVAPSIFSINGIDVINGEIEGIKNKLNDILDTIKQIVSVSQGSFSNATSRYTVHTGVIGVDKDSFNKVKIEVTRPHTEGYNKYYFGYRTFSVKEGNPVVLTPIREVSADNNKDNDEILLNDNEIGIAFTIAEYSTTGSRYNDNFLASSFEGYLTYYKYGFYEEANAYKRNVHKEGMLYNACRVRIDSATSKDCQILLLGDQHGEILPIKNAVQILNGFNTIDAMLNLGDCNAALYNQTFNETYFSALEKAEKPVYMTVGNHDVGYSPLVNEAGSNLQVYDKWIKPIVDAGWLELGEYEAGKSYYYHDFNSGKVRLIVLNAYDDDNEFYEGIWKAITYDNSLSLIGADGTSYSVGDKVNIPNYTEYSFECVQNVTIDSSKRTPTRPSYKFYRGVNVIRQAQAQWFLDTLASTPENYSVVIATHLVPTEEFAIDTNKGGVFCQNLNKTASNFGNYGMYDFLAEAANAFESGNNFNATVTFKSYTGFDGVSAKYAEDYQVSKDFSSPSNKNTGVKFHCFLCGHTHYDLVWKHSTYNLFAVNALAAATSYGRNHVFGDNPALATDICRTDEDSIATDSLTVASFNNNGVKKVSLVKIGVDTTINATKRDYAVLDFNS